MPTDHRAVLAKIKRFDQLIAYLRDEMGWPIARDSFDDVDDLFYDFTADELGIDPKTAAKIESIKRLRPLSPRQRWGIFFVKFEPKKLPVVALRRILSRVALKKRASANSAERTAWAADDLLFVSNYGEGDERQISFAHFSQDRTKADLPILKVLGWNDRDTALHLDGVATELATKLSWPEDESNIDRWREKWRSAFTLRPDEVIKTSKALAVELAKLARRIRDRIRTVLAIETEHGPVTKLMKAFQEALVHDLDADGFADMYAQTIAYGLLSARVTNPKANTAEGFAAQLPVTNPFLKELMGTFLHVGGRKGKAGRGPGIDFDELGVSEIVELLDDANMEAVVRDFGDKNPQEDPVIHFYELFLKEYDAKKRMQRGVFYTPRPVVSYIVRSVHELLQSEFGLADGLADTTTWGEMAKRHQGLTIPDGAKPTDRFVTVLDPATGTGTFLVEAIEVIHRTLVEKWKREGHADKKVLDLWNNYVPRHLLSRLHGYELLMAPYAIAHLKIGLKLHETGYRFQSDERARIYLTNALEPAHDFSGTLAFAIPALAHEAEAVNAIKTLQRFTVVIGNPPYSVSSHNKSDFIESLMDTYKTGLQRERNIQPLSDDYVKFFRLAHAILANAGGGILGYITNHSYLSGVIHRTMRKSLLETFDQIRVTDLHGNSFIDEHPPAGVRDENVFEIQQGVALFIGCKAKVCSQALQFAELWGPASLKLAILADANRPIRVSAVESLPEYFFFVPKDFANADEYSTWPALNEMFNVNQNGIQTGHDSFIVGFLPTEITPHVEDFLSPSLSDREIRERYELGDNSGWNLAQKRQRLRGTAVDRKRLLRYHYRPFDTRFIYYNPALLKRSSPAIMPHLAGRRNVALFSMRKIVPTFAYTFFGVVDSVVDHGFFYMGNQGSSSCFPLFLFRTQSSLAMDGDCEHNFDAAFVGKITRELNLENAGGAKFPSDLTPEDIFQYAYAVFHSSTYRIRYAEFLKIDFPRLPLTSSLALFRALGRLGGELVALHLMEAPAQEAVSARYDKAVRGWCYEVAKGHRLPVTLSINGPEKPVVGKVAWSDDTVWIDAVKPGKGAADARVTGTVGFRGVPEEVWKFHIGGYQVCEKWLKDRKDRTLNAEDIAHYHRIVIALYETIRLMRKIDEVIDAHGGWPGAFQAAEAKTEAATVVRFKPRIIQPSREDRYVTCVPLVPLKAAAGAFSGQQHVEDDNWEWVEIDSTHRLRPGMFVAQVVGKSMEPAIPDGSYCLFAAPVTGTRQGKTVLVQLRDATDPETGERYTVKRYESEKTTDGNSWRHAKITLKPVNPDFEPIVITGVEEGQLQVIAEYVEVLGGQS